MALEADARQRPDEADEALRRARDAAPQAARPRVIEGQRLALAHRHREAMSAWGELLALQPSAFALVATEYAASAQACGEVASGTAQLQAVYARSPSTDLLTALLRLEPDSKARLVLVRWHLQSQPTLSSAAALLEELTAQGMTPSSADTAQLGKLTAAAARPSQRYRCAACGFEAQQYFWQCPGCQSWDSYPPRRIEDT
jgi:lipopolysaccharide biosynthesis regulator YciM